MSELYQHLLIPQDAEFVPEVDQVARFFASFEALGALPNEARFTTITYTGKTRAYGRNPNTGEVYYGPEIMVSRFTELQCAVDFIAAEKDFDLSAEGMGPTAISPFDLYNADNYASRQPGVFWQKPYSFSVRCKRRQKITHFLHSSFGCKCDLKPDELGHFENPWNHAPIPAKALGCASFWIQIGIGNYLMPMVTDTLEILDARLVAAANDVFGIEFEQGCIRNDD